MDIFIHRHGKRVGPFDEAEIRTGVENGEYQPSDLAWVAGRATWHPLKEILELPETRGDESDSPLDVDTSGSADQIVSQGSAKTPVAQYGTGNTLTRQQVIDTGMPVVFLTVLDGAALWFFSPPDETIELVAALVVVALRLAVVLFAMLRQSRIAALLCLIPPILSFWIIFQTPMPTMGLPVWVSVLQQLPIVISSLFLMLVARLIFAVFRFHRGRNGSSSGQ